MAILMDKEIRKWAQYSVVPYCSKRINPASMDLTLGSEYIDLYNNTKITADQVTLYPPSAWRELVYKVQARAAKLLGMGRVYHKPTSILIRTEELIYLPDDMAGDIKMKTTPARKGLIHTLAGWVDPGYMGTLTLTLHTTRKVTLKAGTPICQIVLHKLSEPCEVSYRQVGHYMNQISPTLAKEIDYE